MTEVPPSRYRVVERGRRLEVIDTRVDPGAAPSRREVLRGLPNKTRFDGTREWTTRGWYDAGGPRRVRLGPVGMQALGYAAIAVAVATVTLAVLFGPGVLVGLAVMAALATQHGRPWLTRQLDRIAVE